MQRSLKVKAVTEPARPTDGYRVLIERSWPYGSPVERRLVDYWANELAPSPELETWHLEHNGQWYTFKRRYLSELRDRFEYIVDLYNHIGNNDIVTLVHNGMDQLKNNAVVLAAYLVLEPYFSLLRG